MRLCFHTSHGPWEYISCYQSGCTAFQQFSPFNNLSSPTGYLFFIIQYKTSSSTVVQFISKTLGMCIASYYYTLTAAVMMIVILIKEIIYDFFVAVFRKEEDNLEDIQNEDTQNDIVGNMQSQRNLTTSYRIENNPAYFEILSIKEKMKKKIENGEIHSEKDEKMWIPHITSTNKWSFFFEVNENQTKKIQQKKILENLFSYYLFFSLSQRHILQYKPHKSWLIHNQLPIINRKTKYDVSHHFICHRPQLFLVPWIRPHLPLGYRLYCSNSCQKNQPLPSCCPLLYCRCFDHLFGWWRILPIPSQVWAV